jgi:hypothetical protein
MHNKQTEFHILHSPRSIYSICYSHSTIHSSPTAHTQLLDLQLELSFVAHKPGTKSSTRSSQDFPATKTRRRYLLAPHDESRTHDLLLLPLNHILRPLDLDLTNLLGPALPTNHSKMCRPTGYRHSHCGHRTVQPSEWILPSETCSAKRKILELFPNNLDERGYNGSELEELRSECQLDFFEHGAVWKAKRGSCGECQLRRNSELHKQRESEHKSEAVAVPQESADVVRPTGAQDATERQRGLTCAEERRANEHRAKSVAMLEERAEKLQQKEAKIRAGTMRRNEYIGSAEWQRAAETEDEEEHLPEAQEGGEGENEPTEPKDHDKPDEDDDDYPDSPTVREAQARNYDLTVLHSARHSSIDLSKRMVCLLETTQLELAEIRKHKAMCIAWHNKRCELEIRQREEENAVRERKKAEEGAEGEKRRRERDEYRKRGSGWNPVNLGLLKES